MEIEEKWTGEALFKQDTERRQVGEKKLCELKRFERKKATVN